MLRRAAGWAAIGVGAFMALGILLNLGRGFGALAFLLALAFCTALPIGVGVALLRGRVDRALGEGATEAWGSELLRLAERRGGSLTVAEVVAHVDLSPEAAEHHLDRLCLQGVAEHRVSESGVMVYRFAGLLTAREKRHAEGVLDA